MRAGGANGERSNSKKNLDAMKAEVGNFKRKLAGWNAEKEDERDAQRDEYGHAHLLTLPLPAG